MNENEIRAQLNRLAEYHAERDAVALEKQALVDSVLTPEIKTRLAEIDLEFAAREDAVDANISEMESHVKTAVIAHGGSVKADYLHAVWAKGRVSWDTKSLDGYAVAHPELFAFRKEGQPSVSIRTAK